MRKTSVYLSDEEAEALRVFASTHGRSQADLIREAVRRLIAGDGTAPRRRFAFEGTGHGGGASEYEIDTDALYAEAMGLNHAHAPSERSGNRRRS